MKITRHGSRKYHFETTIADGGNRTYINWDTLTNELTIRNEYQSDPHQPSQYDYTVRLSIPEVTAIIHVLAESAIESAPTEFHEKLSNEIKSIQKISLCSLGLNANEITEIVNNSE